LAPQKKKKALLKPMQQINTRIIQTKEEQRTFKKALSTTTKRGNLFVPAGQSTQLIVGATPDKDLSILKLSEVYTATLI
jgi:predicted DNA-binding helix-hairpin-helix protein